MFNNIIFQTILEGYSSNCIMVLYIVLLLLKNSLVTFQCMVSRDKTNNAKKTDDIS